MNPLEGQFQQASLRGGGRAANPFAAILGSIGDAGRDRRRAQLDLDTYAAKRNMDLQVHDEYNKRHKAVAEGLDPDITHYETSPLGGVSIRRSEPSKKKKAAAAAAAEQAPAESTRASVSDSQLKAKDESGTGSLFADQEPPSYTQGAFNFDEPGPSPKPAPKETAAEQKPAQVPHHNAGAGFPDLGGVWEGAGQGSPASRGYANALFTPASPQSEPFNKLFGKKTGSSMSPESRSLDKGLHQSMLSKFQNRDEQ
jgi:hypothetical protein